MTRADRDLIAFHAAFGLAAAAVLLAPDVVLPAQGAALSLGAVGWRVLALVVLYNAALPLWARARGHAAAVRLWRFLVPVSAFQVVPDAFLVDVLGVLAFPDTGGPRLGPVPLALLGMWTIPLFGIVWTAQRVEQGRGPRAAAWAAAAFALVAFGIAEATLWAVPIWEAQDVTVVGRVALYVLAPEALLGAAAYLAEGWTRGSGPLARVGAAAMVALLYLGALGASYYVMEGA